MIIVLVLWVINRTHHGLKLTLCLSWNGKTNKTSKPNEHVVGFFFSALFVKKMERLLPLQGEAVTGLF